MKIKLMTDEITIKKTKIDLNKEMVIESGTMHIHK